MDKLRHYRRNRLGKIRRLLPAPLLRVLRWLKGRLTSQGRMRLWLERNQSELLLQPSPETRRDRHPEFFALARSRFAATPRPRILSYGCSTGEEALTLAEYLPLAQIDGTDINPRSIASAERALRKSGLSAVRFSCNGSPPDDVEAYDAIFCLSVLRHGQLEFERLQSCADVLPFARFAETIAALDRALRPGGLLFLWGCNFRFADTATARGYRVIATPQKRPEYGFCYGPDNNLLPVGPNTDFVFEKLSG